MTPSLQRQRWTVEQNPSYGYRAVHVIANVGGKLIEIQVRSSLQHLWAELSEKFSDVVDPNIKYGGGDDAIRSLLTKASDNVAGIEELEESLLRLKERHVNEEGLQEIHQQLVSLKEQFVDTLTHAMSSVENLRGADNDLLD